MHSSFQIGQKTIGEGHPCYVIAEAGVNHNGSLALALKLVDAAAEAGADAVKFQKRDLKQLYPESLLANPNTAEWSFQYLLPVLIETELDWDDFRSIKQRCKEKGIQFLCTPWDESSVEFLENLGVDAFKISSADIVNLPLLKRASRSGKPLILSSGMATEAEIEKTVAYMKRLGTPFAMLHCVSTYPAPFEHLNLRYLEKLKTHGIPIGYSGHERGIAIPLVAMTLGATIIEKHITTDRMLPGPDHPASLEPQGFQKLVRDLRNAETAMGVAEKVLNRMELQNRHVLRKSLVAAKDLGAGTVITEDLVAVKGPGKGLSPQAIDELIGVRITRSIAKDEPFDDSDIVPVASGEVSASRFTKPWGLKARFHDMDAVLSRKPQLIEFHFSEEDLDFNFPRPAVPHPQQLFVHAPEFMNRRLIDLCSKDDVVRENSIRILQRTIDKAADLGKHFSAGPPSVVVHVGGMSMDEPDQTVDRMLARAVDSFRRLDPKGVKLLPESLPPRPWYFGGQWNQIAFVHAEDMVDFCKELGLGMTLDLSHAQLHCNFHHKKLDQYVRACLPHVRHLHIADASGIDGEGLQIGDGVVDWERVMELLQRDDFSWLPEIWDGHRNDGAGFVEALRRLSKFRNL